MDNKDVYTPGIFSTLLTGKRAQELLSKKSAKSSAFCAAKLLKLVQGCEGVCVGCWGLRFLCVRKSTRRVHICRFQLVIKGVGKGMEKFFTKVRDLGRRIRFCGKCLLAEILETSCLLFLILLIL